MAFPQTVFRQFMVQDMTRMSGQTRLINAMRNIVSLESCT